MKLRLSSGWGKGEAWRLFPNIEVYNNPDNLWISLVFCKWEVSIALTSDYEEE